MPQARKSNEIGMNTTNEEVYKGRTSLVERVAD